MQKCLDQWFNFVSVFAKNTVSIGRLSFQAFSHPTHPEQYEHDIEQYNIKTGSVEQLTFLDKN